MKSKAKTSSKILTAVLIVLSVALSAVLVAGAFMHIMNNESGVPGFAPDSDKTMDESNPVNTDEADIQENAGETVPNDESVILSPVSPSAQAVYSEEPTVEFHEKRFLSFVPEIILFTPTFTARRSVLQVELTLSTTLSQCIPTSRSL